MTFVCALAAPFAGPLRAQDQAGSTDTAPSAAIVLTTTDPRIGGAFYTEFDGDGELAELPLDHHFALAVHTDGTVKSETKPGDMGYLSVSLYPKAILELYRAEIDEQWETIRDSAALGLTQLGVGAKQAAIMMRDARTFPEQIQSVKLSVSQDPQTMLKGMRVHLKIEPTQGSWIGKLFAMMRPHAEGAPHLDNQSGLVRISAAMDPNGIPEALSPFIEILANIGARNKAQRLSHASMFQKMLQSFDGGFSSAGDPFGGQATTIFSLRDPGLISSVLKSEAFARYSDISNRVGGGVIETEMEHDVIKHRDVSVMRTTVLLELVDSTASTNLGDQVTYSAVAGSHLLSTGNREADDIKRLIDGALDQKIGRKPLANNALVIVNVKLMEFLDKISPVGNPLEGTEDNPQSLRLSIDSTGGNLNLRIALN